MLLDLFDFLGITVVAIMWLLTLRSYRLSPKSRRLNLIFGASTCCALVALGSVFIPDVRLWGSPRGMGDYVGGAATVGVLAVFWLAT
jgi:hypothetical protein